MATAAKAVGNYTAGLTKVFRNSMRKGKQVHCQTVDGQAYVTNGYIICRMSAYEYDALVRPVVKRDMGNWKYVDGAQSDAAPADVKSILDDASCKKLYPVTCINVCEVDSNGNTIAGAYSTEGGFVTGYGSDYVKAFATLPDTTCAANRATGPMVVSNRCTGETVGMILPFRLDERFRDVLEMYAGIKTAGAASETIADDAIESMRRELHELRDSCAQEKNRADTLAQACENLRNKLDSEKRHAEAAEADCKNMECMVKAVREHNDEIRAERDSLRKELEKLRAEMGAQTKAQAAQNTEAAGQTQEEKLASMGLTVEVKGAKSAHPVAWIVGDTTGHDAALRDMGWTWAGKRQAWYKDGRSI